MNRTQGDEKEKYSKDIFANKYIKNLNLWNQAYIDEKIENK